MTTNFLKRFFKAHVSLLTYDENKKMKTIIAPKEGLTMKGLIKSDYFSSVMRGLSELTITSVYEQQYSFNYLLYKFKNEGKEYFIEVLVPHDIAEMKKAIWIFNAINKDRHYFRLFEKVLNEEN